MALAHAGLRGSFPEEHDWGELAFYLAFFVWGYYSFEAVSMTVLFSANASAWALAAPGLGMRVGRFRTALPRRVGEPSPPFVLGVAEPRTH